MFIMELIFLSWAVKQDYRLNALGKTSIAKVIQSYRWNNHTEIIHYDGRKQSQLKFVLDVKQTHLVL